MYYCCKEDTFVNEVLHLSLTIRKRADNSHFLRDYDINMIISGVLFHIAYVLLINSQCQAL